MSVILTLDTAVTSLGIASIQYTHIAVVMSISLASTENSPWYFALAMTCPRTGLIEIIFRASSTGTINASSQR